MKKIYLLVLAALSVCTLAFSQTANYYIFSAASSASIDPMTGATVIVPANTDNTPSAVQTIPFTFFYEGRSYTQFSASPDGFLKFGGTATAPNPYNNTYSATSMLFPFWTNLATGVGGSVSFVVTGTAPNRILKVQWFLTIPVSTSGNANSTMQAWLYETTNVIEFRYGTGGNPSSGTSIGIKGAASDFVSVTAAANNTTSTASTTSPNDNNRQWPGSGTMYQFTPPVVSACNRPTTQPTSLTLPDRAPTYIGGYFKAAKGPAAGYLVISTHDAFTGNLVDGRVYTSGDTIGNGKVVQSGDSSTLSFTADGLNSNTQYYLYVFSYNTGKCSGGPVYDSQFPLIGVNTTCTAAPLPSVATLAPTSALIKWPSVKGGNALTVTYTVDVASDNSFASPIAGSPFTINEPDTSLNISGLKEYTTYYYRVKSTGTCTTIKSFNFTTPCSPTSIQYVQNFDAASTTNLPACTLAEDLQGNTAWTTAVAPKGYTGNVAQFTYSNYQYADDWLYTQGMNLTGGTAYTIGYKFGNDSALYASGYALSMDVKYGTSPISSAMSNLLKSRPNISYRTPQVDTVKFTPATTGTYYFGFHAYNYIFVQNPFYIYLDSIVIKQTGTTLPVSLAAFNAKHTGSANELSWITALENNTSQFVVERSNDGRNFIKIGEVVAAGTSSTPRSYKFNDVSPVKGTNYYRLRIIDRDDNFKLSDVRIVKNIEGGVFSMYPNPAKEVMKIDFNATRTDKGVMTITDMNGRRVYNQSVHVSEGDNTFSVDLRNLAQGSYIIKLQLSDDIIVNKFTKL